MMEKFVDRLAIRELLENWVLWRDAGQWARFSSLWHSDGWMVATWFEAPASNFIARSRAAFEAGLNVFHTLGGTAIDLHGDRAIAQTKMQIVQRASVHGVLVDVTCSGRFWDALEKEDGRWKLLLRQPIYEIDRMAVVTPGPAPELEADLLASFPEGYRHLAYIQTQMGMQVSRQRPVARSPEADRLEQAGVDWLSGGDRSGLSLLSPGFARRPD